MAALALSQSSPWLQPPRALLVDDEPDVRRMVQRCLARAGFETFEVANGRVALEVLRREVFDLVVSDVQMPVMTGIDLLAALERENLDVPVLLVSGSLEVPDVHAARRLGAFDFFRKPFSIAELQASARRAVERRRTSQSGQHRIA